MGERLKATMSVPNMGKLLGLKKVESYWLVQKGYFETVTINGKMRVVIDSFEDWYAGQVRYHKVSGKPPGENLRKVSYSARDIGEMLGLSEAYAYDLIRQFNLPTVTVYGWKRVPKEDFDRWYAGQTKYLKPEDRILHPEAKDYHCADCLTGVGKGKAAGEKKTWKKPEKTAGNADYYTPQEIAYMAKVELRTVQRWVRKGELPAVRISRTIIRIPRREAEQFLLSRVSKVKGEE